MRIYRFSPLRIAMATRRNRATLSNKQEKLFVSDEFIMKFEKTSLMPIWLWVSVWRIKFIPCNLEVLTSLNSQILRFDNALNMNPRNWLKLLVQLTARSKLLISSFYLDGFFGRNIYKDSECLIWNASIWIWRHTGIEWHFECGYSRIFNTNTAKPLKIKLIES